MHARTHDGRAFRLLTLIDESTRECLAIDVARRLTSEDVLERLSDLRGDGLRGGGRLCSHRLVQRHRHLRGRGHLLGPRAV